MPAGAGCWTCQTTEASIARQRIIEAVGDVPTRYLPHGRDSIYEARVRIVNLGCVTPPSDSTCWWKP